MVSTTTDLWTAFYEVTKDTKVKAFPTTFQSDLEIVSVGLETNYLSSEEILELSDILESSFYFVIDQTQDRMYENDMVTYAKYNITIFERI